MTDVSGLLSRRSLYWAAWILFIVSAYGTGTYLMARMVTWSEARPGSAASLNLLHVVIFTLAMFSNTVFLFAASIRNCRNFTLTCKGYLIGAVAINLSVAFTFPEFAQMPVYWLWLASFVALAYGLLAFPPGAVAVAVQGTPEKPVPVAAAGAETGDVPQIIWFWLGACVFWLLVTAINRWHPDGNAPKAAPVAVAITGYLTDGANLVETGKALQIDRALAKFDEATTSQIAVAIYPKLPYGSIEQFTMDVADQSRLGRKGLDNGAILFVFAAERSARLEVGYGLEGVLTDVDAHSILETKLVPSFAKGDYAEGLDTALGAIFTAVQDAHHRDRMPGRLVVLWRQLKAEVPKLLRGALPILDALALDERIGIAFFAGLIGVGMWDGLCQSARLLRNLTRAVRNLVARRPLRAGMESVALESMVDTLKVTGFVLGVIIVAAQLVIVAGGGAFGGAGALVVW